METLQIRKKAVKTWWHIPSDQKEYAVSKLYCKFNGEWFRVVEQGGRQRGEYHYSQITVFDDTQGGSAETFASPLALFLRLEALEYVGFEWGSGGGGVGFQPQIIAPQDGQVITYDNGIWQNGFLDLQGNRFIQTQDIPPIEDNILTVPFGFVWILNTITYSNLTDWTNTIPFTSSEEMVRTDIIVAIASNTFVRIQGEENDGFPIQPTLPPNSLLVTSIDVYHDSFGTPTEPITGNQFIKKSSEAFVQVVPTEEEFKLNIDNHRNFVVNSALEQTTIVGISKTTSNGSTSTDTNWSGSDLHIYRKIGSGALKIKHHSIPDFAAWGYTLYFPDGEDYDMEEGEMLTFRLMQHGTLITNSPIMAFPIYIFAGSSKGGGGASTSDDVTNNSDVDGANVTNALNTLKGRIIGEAGQLPFTNEEEDGIEMRLLAGDKDFNVTYGGANSLIGWSNQTKTWNNQVFSADLENNTIVKRTANGRVKGANATEDDDLVNFLQFKTSIPNTGVKYYTNKFIKEGDVTLEDERFKGLLDVVFYRDIPETEIQIKEWNSNRSISGVYRTYISFKTVDGTDLPYVFTPQTNLKYFNSPTPVTGIHRVYFYEAQTSFIAGHMIIDFNNVLSENTSPIILDNGEGVFSNFAFNIDYPHNDTIFIREDKLSKSIIEGKGFKSIKLKESIGKNVYLYRYAFNVLNSGVYRQYVHLYNNDSNIATGNAPAYFMSESNALFITTDAPISGLQEFNLYKSGEVIGQVVVDLDILPDGVVNISSSALGKNGQLDNNCYVWGDENNTSFDEEVYRLLLGNDLWLVDKNNIQIFKDNVFSAKPYKGRLSIQSDQNSNPITEVFENSLLLNSENFSDGDNVRIYNSVFGNNTLYNKTVTVNKVNTTTLENKEADVILFGDSITNGVTNPQSVAQYVNENVNTDWGADVTFQGLRNNNGVNHEGRNSWEYAILIGLRTQYSSTIYTPSDTNDGDLSLNPFLAIATPQQLIDNPEYCFENTPSTNGGTAGKARELNYTESQLEGTYSGDYYTFSFEKYCDVNLGGLDPLKKLIVTCALGFNDLNHNGKTEQSKLDCLLGMEIFFNRVKEYRVDAEVGFIPIVSVHQSNDWSQFSNLIERAIVKANDLGADIVPVWYSVDMIGGYAYDGSEVDLSEDNDTKKSTGGDAVHPTMFGAKQYGNVVSCYIANKL